MNSADKIKQSIKKLNDKTSEQLDKRTLKDMYSAIDSQKHTQPKPGAWRIIMNNKIIKLATAAVIIIAVLFGIKQFGGSIDGTSVAWAQVVEKLNSYERYKCHQRIVSYDGRETPEMDVYHLNLSQRCQVTEDGDIHIIDMTGEDAVTVELKPAEKKAIVTTLLGYGPKKDPDIISMVKKFDQQSTERLGTRTKDGRNLYGFRHKPNEHNDFTVWVDPKTKLPVEIELDHPTMGNTIYLDKFEFNFNLDPLAFSTDIPDNYEVKYINRDYRPLALDRITPKVLKEKLNHQAYTIEPLPWMEKVTTIETINPLDNRTKIYLIGIRSNNNIIVMAQDDYYTTEFMTWLANQQITAQTQSDIKLCSHPNGQEYAKYFLERFMKDEPDFCNGISITDKKFTRMIVMPNGSVLGLAASNSISDVQLLDLANALQQIE